MKFLTEFSMMSNQIYAKVIERKVSADMFMPREKQSQNKIVNG